MESTALESVGFSLFCCFSLTSGVRGSFKFWRPVPCGERLTVHEATPCAQVMGWQWLLEQNLEGELTIPRESGDPDEWCLPEERVGASLIFELRAISSRRPSPPEADYYGAVIFLLHFSLLPVFLPFLS